MADAVTLWSHEEPNSPVGTEDNPLFVSSVDGGVDNGAASAANQVAGNASLASIDTKTPALGQALAAASTPVVLTAAQIAVLATASNQSSELTLVGAVNEAAPGTDIASSGLNGRLQRIAQRLTSLIALLPASLGQKAKTTSLAVTLASDEDLLATAGAVADAAIVAGATGSLSAKLRSISRDIVANIVLAAGEAHLGQVGGHTDTLLATFTRPNDTNTYAAGDVVCNSTSVPSVMTFTSAARTAGGSGTIVGATLVDGASQALKGIFELWVFDTTITMDNDNALFTPTDAELQTLIAVFSFATAFVGDATSGIGGNCIYAAAPQAPGTYNIPSTGTSLFGVLVARNAYVPVAQGTFAVRLRVIQD